MDIIKDILKWLKGLPTKHMENTTPQSISSTPENAPTVPSIDTLKTWDTPANCSHNVRVLCDMAGLSLNEKDIIWACVKQESEFQNYFPDGQPVEHQNLNKDGSLSSTDFGIVQINDWFHIGQGKDFPSVEYVLVNPDKCVQFMIDCSKAGNLSLWSSYKTGAYRAWLPYTPVV